MLNKDSVFVYYLITFLIIVDFIICFVLIYE